MVVVAAWFGWRAYRDIGPAAGVLIGAAVACCAVPIMRECLTVTDDALVDRRAVRVVKLAWDQVAGFRVARPGALWGGFCVVADRLDGTHVDLLSTRAYTRAPSAQHLDELQRLCWTLEERLPGRP
jgi:hypothetical protein